MGERPADVLEDDSRGDSRIVIHSYPSG